MEGLKEFNHSKRQDDWKLEDLNPNTNYCAMAWLNSIVGGNEYSYKLVDCDGDQEAYSLCIKEPQTKRRKRETIKNQFALIFYAILRAFTGQACSNTYSS